MIYLKDYIKPSLIQFIKGDDKKEAIKQMCELMATSPNIEDAAQFKKAILEREEIVSTGIGLGIAIPHVKIDPVKDMTVGIGVCSDGIPWDAIDNKPVKIIIMIAGSKEQHNLYLRILSKFMLVLKKETRRNEIISAKTPEEVVALFSEL